VKPVVFHPAAQVEVKDAAAHYEAQRQGLGQDFRIEVEAALGRITQSPQIYGVELGEFRACPLRRFPYTLFYIDLEDRIWLGAVAHQSRRPGYWAPRKSDLVD
jgi:toxin ParE1/3/4